MNMTKTSQPVTQKLFLYFKSNWSIPKEMVPYFNFCWFSAQRPVHTQDISTRKFYCKASATPQVVQSCSMRISSSLIDVHIHDAITTPHTSTMNTDENMQLQELESKMKFRLKTRINYIPNSPALIHVVHTNHHKRNYNINSWWDITCFSHISTLK